MLFLLLSTLAKNSSINRQNDTRQTVQEFVRSWCKIHFYEWNKCS